MPCWCGGDAKGYSKHVRRKMRTEPCAESRNAHKIYARGYRAQPGKSERIAELKRRRRAGKWPVVRCLTEGQQQEIRLLYKDHEWTIAELATKFFVGRSTIARVIRVPYFKVRPDGPPGARRVPTGVIVELREVQKLSFAKIGRKVGLNPSTCQERYANYLKGKSR